MNISILTEHSLWWLLPIVLCAIVLVYLQYFFRNKYKNDLSKLRTITLATLRTVAYISLLFLLLKPSIKYSKKIIEKPLIIWAQDNSQSIRLSEDSIYYRSEYLEKVDGFLQKLSSKYEIQKLSFGQDVKLVDQFDLSDQSSDYNALISYLKNNISQEDQIQVILAGDGLYNKGNDPRFSVQEVKSPIHSIALGNNKNRKDLSILSLRTNKLAFLKSNLPVRVGYKADYCKGEDIIVRVRSRAEILYQDTIHILTDDFFIEKNFFITPNRTGLQKYELEVLPLDGEANLKNNVHGFIVDVLDSKRKIAICYDSYHPDIAALQSALKTKSNFSISLIDVSKKQVDFSDFNLMILYQLPSQKRGVSVFFDQLKSSSLPFLMVVGGATDIQVLNQLNLGLNVIQNNNLYQNARLLINPNFSIFEINQSLQEELKGFPPLLSPMAKFQFNQESNILGFQRIKGIETELPLFVFSQRDKQKQCYLLGEGIWRWKLQDYKKNNSHDQFNTLINQLVQYLALRVKKNQMELQYDKVYKERDLIRIEAQLYNKSYQLTNKADIEFVLRNAGGESFSYRFERVGNMYELDLRSLSAGLYQFEAKTKASDQELIKKGEFVINSDNLEARNLQASPTLLKNLSDLSGGTHLSLSDLSQFLDTLLKNDEVKSRVSIENNFSIALNFMWILCFIIILMVLEWFLRKYWLGV